MLCYVMLLQSTPNLLCNVTLLQIKTSYIVMLRILPPTDQTCLAKVRLLQESKVVAESRE